MVVHGQGAWPRCMAFLSSGTAASVSSLPRGQKQLARAHSLSCGRPGELRCQNLESMTRIIDCGSARPRGMAKVHGLPLLWHSSQRVFPSPRAKATSSRPFPFLGRPGELRCQNLESMTRTLTDGSARPRGMAKVHGLPFLWHSSQRLFPSPGKSS